MEQKNKMSALEDVFYVYVIKLKIFNKSLFHYWQR